MIDHVTATGVHYTTPKQDREPLYPTLCGKRTVLWRIRSPFSKYDIHDVDCDECILIRFQLLAEGAL